MAKAGALIDGEQGGAPGSHNARRLRRLVAATIGSLLAIGLFLPMPGDTRLVSDLQNIAHAPAFFIIALLASGSLVPLTDRLSPFGAYLLRLGGVVVIAVGTEALQIPLSRDASWGDIAMNLIGGVAGVAAVGAFDKALVRTVRGAAAAAAVTGLTLMLSAAFNILGEHYRKVSAFPVLMDGTDCAQVEWLAAQWSDIDCAALPERWAREDGETAARIELLSGPWPGFAIDEPVADWRQHRELVLDFVNPGDAALEFVLRIHDRDHDFEVTDRFNRGLRLPPGQRTVVRVDLNDVREAPVSRELDLRHVRGLVVYLPDGRNGPHGEIYVTRIGLE